MELKPVKYEVLGHSSERHRVFIEARSKETWTCTDGYGCLNADGEFEDEPSPSNRTDDFIARTRFATPELALANFERHLPAFGKHW
jgi:hypothetical protein